MDDDYPRDDDPLDSEGIPSSEKWYAMISQNWTDEEKENYWQDRENKLNSYFAGVGGGSIVSLGVLALGAGVFPALALGGISCYSVVKLTYPESLTPTWCGKI